MGRGRLHAGALGQLIAWGPRYLDIPREIVFAQTALIQFPFFIAQGSVGASVRGQGGWVARPVSNTSTALSPLRHGVARAARTGAWPVLEGGA